MKRIRMVGLCLVAVFAMTAVAAASASAAAPEYLVCGKAAKVGKTYTGKFSNKECTDSVATGGKYELAPYTSAKKLALKTKSGASSLDVYIPGKGIAGETTCAKSKGEGTITGAKTATAVITFEKCEEAGKVCTSLQAGTKKGEIVTQTLDETLVASSSSKTGVANEVKGGGAGNLSASFNCEGAEFITTGTVAGEVTAVGVASKSQSLVFEITAEGAPKIASAEPLLTDVVGTATLPSGEDVTTEIKGEAFYIS